MQISKPGFYQMDDATYFADPVVGGSVTQSDVKDFLKGTPAAYKWRLDNPQPSTRQQNLGTYVHALATRQPLDVAVYGGTSKTWVAKDAATFHDVAVSKNKLPLLPAEVQTAKNMAEAIANHTYANEVINNAAAQYEQVAIVQDLDTGIWLRGKFDVYHPPEFIMIADIKTTSRSLSSDQLSKTIAEYGYHIQAAAYTQIAGLLTGIDPCRIPFKFIFVSSVAPYEVAVIQLPERALELGDQIFHDGLRLLQACRDTGVWPSHDDTTEIDLPAWVYRNFGGAD